MPGDQNLTAKVSIETTKAIADARELNELYEKLIQNIGVLNGMNVGAGGLGGIPAGAGGVAMPGGGPAPVSGGGLGGGQGAAAPARPGSPGLGFLRAPMDAETAAWYQVSRAEQSERSRASALDRAMVGTQNNLAWMQQSIAGLDNLGPNGSPTGLGAPNGFSVSPFVLMRGARIGAQIIDTVSQTLTSNAVNSRDFRMYDLAPAGGALAGMAAVAPFASAALTIPALGIPIAGAIEIGGAVLGEAGGAAYQRHKEEKEMEAGSLHRMQISGGGSFGTGGDLGGKLLSGAADLASTLAAGGVGNAGLNARAIAGKLRNTLSNPMDPGNLEAIGELGALAKAMPADIANSLNGSYNPAIARLLALRDPSGMASAGYAHNTLGAPDSIEGVLASAQGVRNRAMDAATAVSAIGQYAAGVRNVTASGGSASDIAGALGQERAAVDAAMSFQRQVVADNTGVPGRDAAKALQEAKTALAELGATAAELVHTAASVKAAAGVDIAGTAMATASSGLHIALGTAGRNASGIFNAAMSGMSGEIAATRAAMNTPGLTPDERRAYQRQLSAQQASQYDLQRQAAEFSIVRPSDLLTSDAAFSNLYAQNVAAGNQDPLAVAGLARRGAGATSGAAVEAGIAYNSAAGSGMFDAATLNGLRNNAASLRLAAHQQALSTATLPMTLAMQATDAGLSANLADAFRSGGSVAAGGVLSQQSGVLDVRAGQYAANRDAFNRANPNDVATGNAAYAMEMAGVTSARTGIASARGSFVDSPSARIANDAARYAVQSMEASIFVPGNRLNAYNALLSSDAARLNQMDTELKGPMDEAARANRLAQRQELSLEMIRLNDQRQVGFMSRLEAMQVNGTDRSAMMRVSDPDYLMGNPAGNRAFGSARHNMLPDGTMGPGFTRTPGSPASQANKIELEVTFKNLPSGVAIDRVRNRQDPNVKLSVKAAG